MVDSLQLTLIIALIVMALINTGSLIWAFYLDHKLRGRPTPKVYEVHVEGTRVFSEIDLAAVQEQAKIELQQATHDAAQKLHAAIQHTVEQVAMRVDETTQNTINQEFEKYQVSLQALREQSITEFSKLQKELDERRGRMLEALEKEANAELGRRVDLFNNRLNDVVSSYLVESLGHQVDLGAQMVHILQTLQQHKDEIKRDVLGP